MAVPYLVRLACLVLVAFFLVHAGLAAILAAVSRRALDRASTLRPGAGARFLLVVRLLPVALALMVAALAFAGFLLYEPSAPTEEFGWAFLLAAILGAATCVSGVVRASSAAIRSIVFVRHCRRHDAPVFLLAGIVRRRVTVTPSMRTALTESEFEAALRHEEAHGRSWDNLKRLLILSSPTPFPFTPQFRRLEAAWRRLTEFAADDAAVAGSPDRALALASALVRAGRVSARISPMMLATPLVADSDELADRVQRLLECPPAEPPRRPRRLAWVSLAVACAGASIPLLSGVHRLLEALAH